MEYVERNLISMPRSGHRPLVERPPGRCEEYAFNESDQPNTVSFKGMLVCTL